VRCVLLHGFAGDPASWNDVAIDGERIALPGHPGGCPVSPTWTANLAAIASRIGRCDVVVGYSLGARVALGLVAAGHAPRAVLISVNPGLAEAAAPDDAADRERATRRAGDARWAAQLRRDGIAAFIDAWQAQPLFASQSRVAPARLADRRNRRLALDAEGLAKSLEAMGLAEMPDYRSIIDSRFALIAGADDAKYVAISRALPAPLELIADSGHDPLLEQPAALTSAVDRARNWLD